MVFEKIRQEAGALRHEQLVYCYDPEAGLKAIIGMHSTALGPATGGLRMWDYESEDAALKDVLRLSQGMTYKAAMAGLKWGGGKAVLIGNPKTAKTPAMLRRFGDFVEGQGGRYITAKDVGIGAEDLRIIKTRTQHVLGIEGEAGSSGDPSPATAYGTYQGMLACAKHAFGASSLKGLKIALQGLGSVPYYMLEYLVADGAKMIACDIDPAMVERAQKKYGPEQIETVRAEAIYDVECDIFSPNALGGVINDQTLPRLRAKIVAGAANNQLATASDGYALQSRGMLYSPDYVINGGGLINIYYERAEGGYSRARAFEHVARIGTTLDEIFTRARDEKLPTHVVADRLAEERVRDGQAQAR